MSTMGNERFRRYVRMGYNLYNAAPTPMKKTFHGWANQAYHDYTRAGKFGVRSAPGSGGTASSFETYTRPPRLSRPPKGKKARRNYNRRLRRQRLVFNRRFSTKTWLGTMAAPSSADDPLGPETERVSTDPTNRDHLACMVVKLTSLASTTVGQQGFPAAATPTLTDGRYSEANRVWVNNSASDGFKGEAHNLQTTGLPPHGSGTATGTDSTYIIRGLAYNFTLGGAQVACDQNIQVAIYRLDSLPEQPEGMSLNYMKELCASQRARPNRKHWSQPLLKRNIFIKGRAEGSARAGQRRVQGYIPLNLIRTPTKKVSVQSDHDVGAQYGYAFKTDHSQIYNNLFMVITSRALTTVVPGSVDQTVGSTTILAGDTIIPVAASGATAASTFVNLPRFTIKGWVRTDMAATSINID